ncbi:uncharacterized protein [Miscanthus floridulus]|uniref:uncharacterized protein n=1 Tax=Miscanthus floridulus TaxID=154761 RepID=UPI003459A967
MGIELDPQSARLLELKRGRVMPSKGGLVIQLPPTKEMQLLVHLKGKKVDAQESSTPMPVTRSQLQLTMENMGETSHVNINPGPVTRSQIGGATDPMTTPTRPKKSPTKRAINKKLTPRKRKIYAA